VPTYEKLDDAGAVVERSVTFHGTPLDAQLSHAASNQDSPWRLVGEHGEPVIADTQPVFQEPAQPDGVEGNELDTGDPDIEQHDEPDTSGDHTEE
jgi:hypothetical protein